MRTLHQNKTYLLLEIVLLEKSILSVNTRYKVSKTLFNSSQRWVREEEELSLFFVK